MLPVNHVFIAKAARALLHRADRLLGRFYSLGPLLEARLVRPSELFLEPANACNGNCVFCPYQFQQREPMVMSDAVFQKAVDDYRAIGGGSIGIKPIVGEALLDPQFVARVRYLRSLPEIDRIWLVSNGVALDQFGVEAVLDSGLTSITISTAGFDAEMYARVYRTRSYERMRRNVLDLVRANAARPNPLPIFILLRPDRPLADVLKDPDFQPILASKPQVDFVWRYRSVRGRIRQENLPPVMSLQREGPVKAEPCAMLFNGPTVLSNGEVIACSCLASMDAQRDLGIGNILKSSLLEMWTGQRLREIRDEFTRGAINPTCANCGFYLDLDAYRTRESRQAARINRERFAGVYSKRRTRPSALAGG